MANVIGYNRKLATLLRKHNLVDEKQLQGLNEKANKESLLLASLAVTESLIDELTLIGLVSEDSGWPTLDLDKMKIDLEQLKELNGGNDLVSEEMAKYHAIVPLAQIGEYLTLAVANPYDVVMIDNLKLQLKKQILPVVSSERAITKAIELAYHAADKAVEQLMETMDGLEDDLTLQDAKKEVDENKDDADLTTGGDDSPAVKVVKQIFSTAIKRGASDIHIEPFEKRVRVRLRIDGVLNEVMDLPKRLERAMVSRLKIMTDTMNIAERGKPQDGRIQVSMEGKKVDIRVNSLPVVHGEKVCMRLLAKGNLKDMKEIGFEQQTLDILERALGSPYGMMLVTGPTGSGKSTTLYSCLKSVMTIEDNVNTVEDPVEYEIEGINQCHVNPKRGLTFATALRALLRQDPDTIMIGEIRDQETIEIAVKAALTGHLVLSTLHTNDAPSTISRILDMGIEPFLCASTVLAILAQRLGRRLCKNCRIEMPKGEYPSRPQLLEIGYLPEEIEGLKLWKPVGCSLCSGGYKGRFALVECLEMNDDLRRVIIGGGTAIEIRKKAVETGMITLRRCGLLNAARGVTTVEEVMRHTVGEEEDRQENQPKKSADAAEEPTPAATVAG
ncbi:MAG: Flp pilus assembly complex ATPase component TadA [Planctomycetes bacterium]|nr:Flp pilus assembly complex ATPase component TadA [Planctomycetota bacterium]